MRVREPLSGIPITCLTACFETRSIPLLPLCARVPGNVKISFATKDPDTMWLIFIQILQSFLQLSVTLGKK